MTELLGGGGPGRVEDGDLIGRVRRFQRHKLLRVYDDKSGKVIPECVEASSYIDALVDRIEELEAAESK